MEKAADRNRLRDAHTYFQNEKDKCIIIDEVQLMPNLFSELRPVIDEYRKAGRFVLMGSASPFLVKGVSESLAGRISYTELTPIGLQEIPKTIPKEKHWFRGGFPNALLAKSNKEAGAWVENFITSYVQRDIQLLFGVNLSANIIHRLWTMLAHANGSIWNAETFSRSLGITAPTVLRYVDYLEGGYMIRRLLPWYANVKKRLVKSPKIYVRDSGLLHHLLHLHNINDVLGHPVAGTSWEGYVIEQVYQNLKPGLQMYYYRTHDGAECDLVLVKGIRPVCCIEIKLTNAPVISKGFFHCIKDLKPTFRYVITPDSTDYTDKEKIVVTGISRFLSEHLKSV